MVMLLATDVDGSGGGGSGDEMLAHTVRDTAVAVDSEAAAVLDWVGGEGVWGMLTGTAALCTSFALCALYVEQQSGSRLAGCRVWLKGGGAGASYEIG